MPHQLARKRLKKKMLDRWENEGGSIATAPTSAGETGQVSDQEGGGKQLSASRDNSTVGTPPSPPKRSKPPRK
jgi:hypothetical protein